LGPIFGFPLSGLHLASLWATNVSGGDTVLGGAYGPESGIVATFIFGASALIVHATIRIRSSSHEYRDAGAHQLEE
jgi:hypothetical protein